MRIRCLLPLALVICLPVTAMGGLPISSFEPDTTVKRAPRDTVDRPVWVGIHASPFAGGSTEPGLSTEWDTDGMPWFAMTAAWPSATPNETWLAVGYEHWKLTAKPETVPFGPILLPFLSPLVIDLLTVRGGLDGLLFRDHLVSAAFGVGGGAGYGKASVGTIAEQGVIPLELLGHAFLYVRAGKAVRFGLGASAGETYLWSHGDVGDPFAHWEFELRFDRAVYRPAHREPAP